MNHEGLGNSSGNSSGENIVKNDFQPDKDFSGHDNEINSGEEEIIVSFIREWSGHFRKEELIKELRENTREKFPEEITSSNYNRIIQKLLKTNMIAVDSKGYIGWIFSRELYTKYATKPELRLRQ
ncbi:hypothetical protein [Methanoplanus endosymbiosus]|uniref:Uncharacterized protein n=1 Tax=Methanoplanus endosymbiosus TaxID=33865 RepID=A0A9E7PN79_9EURY|nr:hypothetical protein [Methanoplanus endosymbiosus]UUX93378.1 hypothetical protein L6E24_04430 [Methanoplanus endosymbiosus]